MSFAKQVSKPNIAQQLRDFAASFDTDLQAVVDELKIEMTPAYDSRFAEAVEYGVVAPGKRIRPFLVQACAEACQDGPLDTTTLRCVRRLGAAAEHMHAGSLVIDDLPDIDNDTLRRGQPTVWTKYDPATAILAGIMLISSGMSIVSKPETHPDPEKRSEFMKLLGDAVSRVTIGEMEDIQIENAPKGKVDEKHMEHMLQMKTAEVIAICCELGGVTVSASEPQKQALRDYGLALGKAFQIKDDILDAEGGQEYKQGKNTGRDAEQGKINSLSFADIATAKKNADAQIKLAVSALERKDPDTGKPLFNPEKAASLKELATFAGQGRQK